MKIVARWQAVACSVVALSAATGAIAGGDDSYGRAHGWYVSAMLGGPLPLKQYFDTPTVSAGHYDPDWGIGGGLAIGRHLDDDWRVDLAVSWVRGFDGITRLDNGFTAKFNGHSDVYSVMLNAYRNLGTISTHMGDIQPFVGAGVGFTHFDIRELGGPFTTDPRDTVFSASVAVGYDLRLSDRVTFTSKYTLGYTTQASFQTILPGVATTRDAQFDHFLHSGLRFDLN